ncbi:MAG: hypothetical protein JW902_15225 [Syntrophaceae bacterium]|nr:hypothetical protein [Syntrophaceae bacterium]
MKKRPLSLTIIGWLLIIMGISSIFATSAYLKNPEVIEAMAQSPLPLSLQHAMLALGVMIMTGCGIGILKGKNWARMLYLGWGLFSILVSLAIGSLHVSMLPSLILFFIMAYFLFRPKAQIYFSPDDT